MAKVKNRKSRVQNSVLKKIKSTKTEESSVSLSDKIQILMLIVTFLSLVGVGLTLNEMKKDRDAAYKPTLLTNAADFRISWDSNGEEDWLSSLPKESNSSYEVREDGSIKGTFTLPINIFPNDELESLSVVNVGVGTAKDICFEWDTDNISRLCDYLVECNSSKSNFCTIGESAAFSFDERLVVTDIDRNIKLMYMLPNAQEIYTIPLPMAYSILIHEIMKCSSLPKHMYIVLRAEYFDIQGKKARDTFYITINRTYYRTSVDSSGTATYQLTPVLLVE